MTAYLGLFVTAFLAATLLPLPSELTLVLLMRERDAVWLPVGVATTGNFLGACTTYVLARGLFDRPREGRSTVRRALMLFERFGSATLLFSWVPVVGDAFVALAGAAAMPVLRFSVLTLAGKAARYLFVAWAFT